MKKFLTIFKFTYTQNLKRKGFLIVTVIGILLMAVLFNINKITEKFSSSGEKKIVVFDEGSALEISDEALKTLDDSKYKFILETDKNAAEKVKDSINSGKSDYFGMVEIKLDNKRLVSSFYVKTLTDGSIANRIDAFVNSAVFHKKASSLNLSQEEYQYLLESIKLDVVQKQEITEDKFMLVYGLILALYGVIMYYGSVVANSVIEEKSNRIMETLITMAKPLELFAGKVLAICALGITQLTIFGASGFVFYKYFGGDISILSEIKLSGGTAAIFVACFLLGYLIYSLIYGALGSLVSSSQDSTAALLPMTLVLIIVFITAISCIESIDGTMAKVLSYIPLSSPIVMFERVMVSTVKPIEIVISGIIAVGTILITGYLSSKIYKRGVLHYGTRLSILKAISR